MIRSVKSIRNIRSVKSIRSGETAEKGRNRAVLGPDSGIRDIRSVRSKARRCLSFYTRTHDLPLIDLLTIKTDVRERDSSRETLRTYVPYAPYGPNGGGAWPAR